MTHHIALPGSRAPELRARGLDGVAVDLASERTGQFTVIFFYRGVHCPICKTQLEELGRRLGEFAERGLSVLAVSMDSEDRANGKRWSGRPAISGLAMICPKPTPGQGMGSVHLAQGKGQRA